MSVLSKFFGSKKEEPEMDARVEEAEKALNDSVAKLTVIVKTVEENRNKAMFDMMDDALKNIGEGR